MCQISRNLDQKFTLIWEMSYELNCSFLKLFKPVDLFSLKEYYISKYPKKFRSLVYKSLKQVGLNFPLGYRKYIFNSDIEKAKKNNYVMELFAHDYPIFVCTVNQFYEAPDSFSYFTPIDEVNDSVENVKKGFLANTIGIHIRRTDNVISIKSSPREAFVAKMKEAVDENNDTRFFLATDSPEEENFLSTEFPGRIISYPKELNRNSEKGIQDALVDLYCLANTKKIIGSYYSSFSEVAAQIKNIPLELICVTK